MDEKLMYINNLVTAKQDDKFTSNLFRQYVNDHLEIIKSKYVHSIVISPRQQEMYVGDFEGLLMELNVPYELIWASMRANDLFSYQDYTGIDDTVLVVDDEFIKYLGNRARTLLLA